MPKLKQLSCCIRWIGTGAPLEESKTKYRDGQVETHIAVPEDPMPFAIHLTSRGYIAPGLAMFVYIDGEYQCNRNRHNLRIPDETSTRRHTEIDFQVRQKEAILTDGSLWAKQWRFEKIIVVPDDTEELANRPPYDGEYIGAIEVVVLRCKKIGPKSYSRPMSTLPEIHPGRSESYEANSKRVLVKSTADDSLESGDVVNTDPSLQLDGLFDGAGDMGVPYVPHQLLGLDGNRHDWEPPKDKSGGNKQWGWEMTGSDAGEFKPMSQGQHDPIKSNSSSRSSGHGPPADERAQSHVGNNAPAGSPTIIINISHPAAGSQKEVRPTARSVAQSNHSSRLRRSKDRSNAKGGKTSKDWGGEAWKVPLPSIEDSNADWTKPQQNSDIVSEVNWNPINSKRDDKTMEWIKNLPAESKDEGQNTGGYWANKSSSRGRRDTNNSQTQGRNDSWCESKQRGQGPNGNMKPRESSGNWGGSNGTAKKESGWNTSKTWNETNRQSSWDKEPKQTSPPFRTTPPTAWNLPAPISPQSPRLRSRSELPQPFPGAWPRSRSPSPPRHEQSRKWSPPQDNFERSQTRPVHPSWGGSSSAGPPKPKAVLEAQSPSNDGHTGWSATLPNVPVDNLYGSEGQVRNTPPASDHASRKLPKSSSSSASRSKSRVRSVSKAPSNWRARSMSNATAKLRAKSISMTKPKANILSASGRSPAEGLVSRLEDPIDIRPVFDPNATDSPLYTIPEEIVKRKNVTHQVNAGRPTAYYHRQSTPKYLDSHDDPYAVFIFKYRSKAALESMLNIKVTESEEAERQRLMELSKDELIEQYLKAKAQAGLKAEIGDSNEVEQATNKLSNIQLNHGDEDENKDESFSNDAPKANGEAWGGWAEGGSHAGGWATGGQVANTSNDIPSRGGNDGKRENPSTRSNGNSGQSWVGDTGRDRSRPTHHNSVRGGNGPPVWAGEQGRNQTRSSNDNTAAFTSAKSNHSRYSSRDKNPGRTQGSGWAGGRDQSWGGETANDARRSDAAGNGGRVAEAAVDW